MIRQSYSSTAENHRVRVLRSHQFFKAGICDDPPTIGLEEPSTARPQSGARRDKDQTPPSPDALSDKNPPSSPTLAGSAAFGGSEFLLPLLRNLDRIGALPVSFRFGQCHARGDEEGSTA
jgi:hypothetical protein